MNLTPKQLRVLRMIHDSRRTQGYSPTMQEIADQLGVSKVTVFEHVEALISKGALVRDRNKARSLSIATDFEFPAAIFGDGVGSGSGDGDEVPSRQLHAEDAAGGERGSRGRRGVRGGPKHTLQESFDGDGAPLRRMSFPLVGRVAAGHPIEKFAQDQTLALEELFGPRSGQRGTTFALRVDGMSMRDEGILDGDYVLVDQRSAARNGERVVALLPNGETTLKTLFREKDGTLRLQPANPDFAPIIIEPDRATEVRIQGVVIAVLRSYRD